MMRKVASLAALAVILAAAPARAQAWLPSQGEISLSFVFSDSFVDEHDLNGLRDPNSNIYTQSMLMDVTFGLRDDLALTLALPVVRSKYESQGTPAHPTVPDNGQFNTTATDLRFDLRYNAFNRRNLVVTPYLGTVTPAHAYEFYAHAAAGRRVKELQLGTYVGTTLDALLPGMFLQGRYGYGIQEQFAGFSHNRSVYSMETGYFATPDLRVFAMVNGQVTHGGVDLSPRSRLEWPALQWVNHDRIIRENFVNVGGGLGWSVNDVVDVFGSYTTQVHSVNTHVLDRAFIIGASFRVQKSALERGIINLSAGNRIARCACQKALALKR